MNRWFEVAEVGWTDGGRSCWTPSGENWSQPLETGPDVLVIGAGIAGAAAAMALTRKGHQVQVIDRNPPGSGVTGRSAGALIPDVHAGRVDPLLTRLGRRGLVLHRRFAAELGYPLHGLDWLELADDLEAVDNDRSRPGRQVSGRELDRLAPGLRGVSSARMVTGQARVHPVMATESMLRTVHRVSVPVAALDLTFDRSKVVAVETTAGTITPGAVVVATGQLPTGLSERPRGTGGHLVVVDAPGVLPAGLGLGTSIVVLPAPGGGLLVGGTRDGPVPPQAPDTEVIAAIRARLTALVPSTATAPTTASWVGFRPTVGDGTPLVDNLSGSTNAIVIGGLDHTGILTAPAIAELVTEYLTVGDALPEALRFEGSARRTVEPASPHEARC